MVTYERNNIILTLTLETFLFSALAAAAEELEVDPLERTGSFCGGLALDIKRRAKFYLSDFKDGFNVQCLLTSIFLYFSVFAPNIAFGSILDKKTDGWLGVSEVIFATCLCGILFGLLAGQPLIIIGVTGPVLVFEQTIYKVTWLLYWQYLNYQVSKARQRFGDQVLTFNSCCCHGQLVLFPVAPYLPLKSLAVKHKKLQATILLSLETRKVVWGSTVSLNVCHQSFVTPCSTDNWSKLQLRVDHENAGFSMQWLAFSLVRVKFIFIWKQVFSLFDHQTQDTTSWPWTLILVWFQLLWSKPQFKLVEILSLSGGFIKVFTREAFGFLRHNLFDLKFFSRKTSLEDEQTRKTMIFSQPVNLRCATLFKWKPWFES